MSGRCGSPTEVRDVRRDGARREQPGGQLDAALCELVQEDGRSPVGRSAPLIVPSGANESILNSKMSCIVMTSDSMRWTSVIAVQRREPSSIRSMWTIMSSAEDTCCRMARTGRSYPP
jgi:hypothetical protein